MAGFLLLCLLWASDSLQSDLVPGQAGKWMPVFERQALEFALLAAVAGIFSVVRKAPVPAARRIIEWVLTSLSLFVVPSLLVHFSRAWIGELTRVALFSLVPVFAVVVDPYVGRGKTMLSGSGMVAALAAVAGTCLVFQVDVPHSISSGAAWCAVIVAAVCIAVANSRAVLLANDEVSLMSTIAIASGTACAGFGLASALTEHPLWSGSGFGLAWTALMSFAALLLFWLMKRMTAVSMTTRFVVAPLFANLAGLAMLRPTLRGRAVAGLLLIAAGAGWLLLARDDAQTSVNMPQTLNLD